MRVKNQLWELSDICCTKVQSSLPEIGDADLDRELRSHLELEAEEQQEDGVSLSEAPIGIARRIVTERNRRVIELAGALALTRVLRTLLFE